MPNLPPQVVSIKTAREDLWRKLQAGDLVAVGKQGFDERVPLPAHLWLDLSVQGDGIRRETLGQPGGSSSSTAWHDVKMKCADVMTIWPHPDASTEISKPTTGDRRKPEYVPGQEIRDWFGGRVKSYSKNLPCPNREDDYRACVKYFEPRKVHSKNFYSLRSTQGHKGVVPLEWRKQGRRSTNTKNK